MGRIGESKHIKTSKIAAFTLFESVIAITIITVLIGLGTLIYSNLINAEQPIAYYQAKSEIDLRFKELCTNKAFFNKQFKADNYQIEQKVEFYKGNKNLYQITYTATAGERKLLTEHHLVIND